MVFAKENIEIVTTMIDNVTGASKRIQKNIQELGMGVARTTEQVTGFNSKGRELNTTTKSIVTGQRRFKMELLGVMFAGMALYRVMGGLIRKQFELWGVTDMFGAMLTVVFLPIMDILAPILYTILDAFMNLPEGLQLALGAFVILAAGIGAFLLIFGQVGLAVTSIGAAFPALGGIISGVFHGIITVVSVAMGLILVVIAIIVGMFIAWKENFMGMKNIVSSFWNHVKDAFSSLFEIIKSIFGVFIAIFKGDWNEAWEHVKNIFYNIGKFVVSTLTGILDFTSMVAVGFIRIFKGIIDSIIGLFKWLYDVLVGHSIIPDLVNGMMAWFKKGADFIIGIFEDAFKVVKKVIDIASKPVSVVKSVGEKVGGFFSSVGNTLGFASGGVVPGPIGAPVPAIVHGGETVIPAGASFGAPNITINATISNDYDVRRLAEELKRYWVTDFERVSKGRGI